MELTKELAEVLAQATREETINYYVGDIPALSHLKQGLREFRDAVSDIETPITETPIKALKSLMRAGVFKSLSESDSLTLFNVFEFYFVLVRNTHTLCLLGCWLDRLIEAIDRVPTEEKSGE
jgi:hypothetical protein